ncbi:hypothetical protein HPB48_017172 [Haemaphysalis longicornis]|uniref:Reverse transcriptase domain-containing protein n=1 Tax=Haemaphysalis longicornis TaxID=44386 RepID=A0A9J6GPT2_HAELO|nr:hypothetical protein HPB48_017172 [Haemaphysalis longicornis]
MYLCNMCNLELITDVLSKTHPGAILRLHVEGEFDRVTDAAIPQGLQITFHGQAMYSFIRAFLTTFSACFCFGRLHINEFPTPPRGAPQGSVISPTLFIIALHDLSAQLTSIRNLHHALYTNDLTWLLPNSPGN